jgi:DNA-binding Xre family transcriptional regulator
MSNIEACIELECLATDLVGLHSDKSLENTPEYKKAWRLIQAIDVAEAALMNLERGETS